MAEMSPQLTLGNPIHRGIFCGSSFDHPHDGPSPEISCSPLATLRFLSSFLKKKKKQKEASNSCFARGRREERRGGGRNGCRPSSNIHLLLFVLPVPAATAVREEAALQGHGHGSPEEGNQASHAPSRLKLEMCSSMIHPWRINWLDIGGAGEQVRR